MVATLVLETSAERRASSSLAWGTNFKEWRMKDTLQKAYGSIPKEVTAYIDLDIFPFRGIKYYWLLLKRKLRSHS